MSGIYIPGMEMPKKCIECRLMRRCGKADLDFVDFVCMPINIYVEDLTNAYRPRPAWCPLIPVPEHGRLIDADALPTYDKPIGKMMMFGGKYVYTHTAIDNAPTIIPADPEK